MTDNEMLQLAAKAVYIELDFNVRGDFAPYYINSRGGHSSWNPLNDDGEALRLANDLYLSIEFTYCQDDAPVVWVRDGYGYEKRHCNFPDPYKAARRAIVQAAAEIQKNYEEITK
jgi:hypothetical protein